MTTEPTHLFLPDFVGYPICFAGLRALVPAAVAATYVDYTAHWPYSSLPALARAICAGAPAPHAITGYSFGAYVAIEVASLLAAAGAAPPRVLLVDPPALSDVAALAARDVASVLRERADYAYVFDLIDCELARLDCMVANIELLGRLAPPVALPGRCTIVLAGDRAPPGELAGPASIHRVRDCDHRSILNDPATLAHIMGAREAAA